MKRRTVVGLGALALVIAGLVWWRRRQTVASSSDVAPSGAAVISIIPRFWAL